jgi:hypothetical protein
LEAELSVKYSVDDLADADESDDFIYLPRGLREWIASQQYILFEGQSILTPEELMPFYKRHCASSDDELLLVPAISPADMILELMEMQLKMLNTLPRGKSSIVDNYSFYGFGKFGVMEVKCNSCNKFWPMMRRLGGQLLIKAFISGEKQPSTLVIQGSSFQAVPQNKSTKFIQANQDQLKKPRWQGQEVEWEHFLQTKEGISGLPTTVESWCIECRYRTSVSKLSGGRAVFVDEKPRWTVGTPAKYLKRKPNCLTCRKESNRFIPVDDKMPSIAKAELVTFAKEFGDGMNARN